MTLLAPALLALAVSFLLALVRVLRGPTVADRAVAADVALYGAVAAIALLALLRDADQLLDVTLVATLLGFLASIALSLLVRRSGS